MNKRRRLKMSSIFQKALAALLLFPAAAQASFIETTIGTAVVNDATAARFNPAALMQLQHPQIIPLATIADFRTRFSGDSTRVSTGLTTSGSSSTHSRYYSPSLYLGMPVTRNLTAGLAIISNYANRDAEGGSVLKYVQSSNNIQDYEMTPAIAYKINDNFALGVGINISYANFNTRPITGIPGTINADSETHNKSDGTGVGVNAGFLYKPGSATVIGFNYRSLTTYHLSGKSIFEGTPQVTANDYHYKLWTPARSILSMNHFVTQKLGFITTINYIQWSTLTNVHAYNIASVSGTTPVIVNVIIPHYLRDTWMLTLGSHYRFTPKLILRVAGSYSQSPGNPHYQIANGDSIIFGGSVGYEINETLTVDGSYAHVFMKNENIDISGGRFLVNGLNEGSRDAVSLKLTVNI